MIVVVVALAGCATPDPADLTDYVARTARVGDAAEPALQRFETDGYVCGGLTVGAPQTGECSRMRNRGLMTCVERIRYAYSGEPRLLTSVKAVVPMACFGGFG